MLILASLKTCGGKHMSGRLWGLVEMLTLSPPQTSLRLTVERMSVRGPQSVLSVCDAPDIPNIGIACPAFLGSAAARCLTGAEQVP